ncbi:MAG: site-2 protease family protein [Desulfobulbaceae bacterium]|nr:MAG: site-2 protease family protein [Desulfobulbaceae bacterium]
MPNISLADLVIQIPTLLLALTLHEYAHGYVAYRFGDPTAKAAGRLTLNPLKHIDPIGTLAFVLIKIGWAKPVPVNPAYFRNPRQDMIWVALAGPATNLLLAVASAALFKLLVGALPYLPNVQIVAAIIIPLSKMLLASVWINLLLCVFNLIPIPPLDGGRIVTGMLPENLARGYASLERYGFILILVLAYFGLFSVILPIINAVRSLLLA